MGDAVLQALTLICTYEDPKLYIVDFDLNGLEVLNVPTSIEWALLVAYHRGKLENIKDSELYNNYNNVILYLEIEDGKVIYCLPHAKE